MSLEQSKTIATTPASHYRKVKPHAALLKVYKGSNTLNTVVIIMAEIYDPKKTIKIENVVASTAIGTTLDLPKITLQLDGADYNKERFPGVVYRTKEPKTAALIFGSGKIVCTGAKSIDDVHNGLKKVYSELKGMGVEVMDNPEIIVQNIVASADLGAVLNLNAIAIGLGLENIEYEPEQFPGLVYRIAEPKVVMLLFGSGKLVVTGGKKPVDADAAVDKIVEELDGLGLL